MRLTAYTDYTLRVMMYLATSYPGGGVVTIMEIARAYDISRSHLKLMPAPSRARTKCW